MRVKADILGRAVDCYVGAPGAHIAANVVGALAAVALLDGDVLNAAAALKNFTALKGRGARFEAGDVTVIDESYNANPASMAAALALLGAAPRAARSRCWATCWKWARAIAIMPAWPRPSTPAIPIWSLPAGREMKALWDALPATAPRRLCGKFRGTGAAAAGGAQARRHGAGERLVRQQDVASSSKR